MRRLKWLIALPLVLIVLVTGGAWAYANLIAGDPIDRLELSDLSVAPAGKRGGPVRPGNFVVTTGSKAGYRVDEVLFGQNVTAVGRTEQVTGALVFDGAAVRSATFEVDLASVTSDQTRRDGHFRNAIMDTERFPTASFALTQPIALGGSPSVGQTVSATATGNLTLRGVARSVTFDVQARLSDSGVDVSGAIPVRFDDWSIPSPSFGPATVEDSCEVEFLFRFVAA